MHKPMTRHITLIFILLFTLSCSQDKKEGIDNNVETVVEKKDFRFFISEYKDKFKHHNLITFDRCSIKDLNGDKFIADQHIPITKDLALKIFQDNKYISDTLTEGTKVLYSIQTDKGHQGILIAGMGDDWVDRIEYISYDFNGKLISRLFLYECGGDGGYSSESFGKFINDTTYIRKSIYCEPKDEETGIYKCDSLNNKFIIHYNGQIEEIKN